MLITELSAEVRAVADMLSAAPVGDTVSLAAISAEIGRDVTGCRHVIASARRVAQRESAAVFVSVRGEGYRRIPVDEVATVVGSAARKHIRRTARRSRAAMSACASRANDLPPEQQRRLSAEMSALGLIEHISRDAIVRPNDNGPQKPMPVGTAARLFLQRVTGEPADA